MKMRPRIKATIVRGFNMIEVTLALGVVSIGIISIMGLFPIGFTATRDATAENYASQAADQLLHRVPYMIRGVPDGWNNIIAVPAAPYDTYVGINYNIYPPSDIDLDTELQNFDHNNSSVADCINPAAPGGVATLYRRKNRPTGVPGGDPLPHGVYKAIGFVDADSNGSYDSGETLEFEGIIKVWRSQIESAPLPMAARLNVEISWPAMAPHSTRQKAVYCLELFNR